MPNPHLTETEISQSGYSLVDFPRRLEGGTRLRGAFVPPGGARSDQRFAILVERVGAETMTAFEWQPSLLSRLQGTQSFDLPLGSHSGFARIRLLATGTGPPARWLGLGLKVPEGTLEKPDDRPPNPPRLVVLYVMDALRADHLGSLGGDPRATPTLDRLAAEGVTFKRHASVAPNTLPSTKSIRLAWGDEGRPRMRRMSPNSGTTQPGSAQLGLFVRRV